MTIRVAACWTGRRDEFRWRLELPDGKREFIIAPSWNRRTAKDALDVLEHVYGLKRSNIRFAVQ